MKSIQIKFKISFFVLLLILGILNSCQKSVDSSAADIAALKASFSALQKTTDSLAKVLAATNYNVASLSSRVDSIRAQIEIVQNQITVLNTQLTITNSNITVINAQIVILSQQYASLLAQLNAILAQLAVTPTSLSYGLVAYYPFTGNANDSSGHGFNGTVNGPTLTTDRFGIQNSAYSFSSNSIGVAHNPLLNLSNSFTISLWYYPTSTNYAQDLVIKGPDSPLYTWWVRHHSTAWSDPNTNFAFRISQQVNQQVGFPTPSLNTWVHVTGIADGNSMKIYKNGLLISTITNVDFSSASTNTYDLTIGTLQYPFIGKIDDIRIYNRVLTQQEITYLATH